MVMHQGMEADLYLRVVSAKGSKPELIMSVQDINIQSQALINVRDSNKAREMNKRKEGMPGEARAATLLRRSVRENGSDLAEQSEVSRSISGPDVIGLRVEALCSSTLNS
ncbi:hypothetical protein HanRHA438_Chr11g0529031 [Helianthus annuus]|nr:hypothetical protein HanRHA438_Chr11g0529031 [Helianthus annuus]